MMKNSMMKNSNEEVRLLTLPKPFLLAGEQFINNEISQLYF